ncbi:MAG TPA: glycogen debranching N-terminal domain-containing protein [Kineosporiaceae bacterium]|nr:glycogen debranching N-terminal domain-containing protein [Kineosporiaceae bacterium]
MARTVDVLEGNTFVVSDERGDIDGSPVEAHGLFDRDTRYLSRWILTLDGERLSTLSVDRTRYYAAQFFLAPGVASAYINAKVAVIRQRTVLGGFHEVISITNHDAVPVTLQVSLAADADFADLFEVKDAVHEKQGRTYRRTEPDRLVLGYEREKYRRETWIRAGADPVYDEAGLSFTITLAPQQAWSTEIDVLTVSDERTPRFQDHSVWDDPEKRLGLRLLQRNLPVLVSSWRPLEAIYRQSVQDMAALRFDLPISPGHYMPAAGLPWFMAAFGRDSLITSFQALPFMPDLAETALVELAMLQATTTDDFRDAEPGKILHELRFGELTAFEERPHSPYYGAADATQLWLVLLDEYERWTGRDDVVHALEAPARAALRWIDEFGDRDGDGYVEYARRNTTTGLENQCWRDSPESIQWADGTLASLPRATSDLQGYAYDAKRRAARLARLVWDDPGLADRLDEQAADLKARFNRDFWLPDRGYYAAALDGDKRPVDSLTSMMGHLLWSGIVEDDKVDRVVELLLGDRLYTGWGIRAFASGQTGYNPIGYHLGTVWPHDTAFAVLALAQHGYRTEACEVAMGLLEAADLMGNRLPEAFAGFVRAETSFPAEYPTACSPQAWASGAPLLLIRALLGMEPDGAVLRSSPALPERIRRLQIFRVPGRWGAKDIGVDLTGEVLTVGLPAGSEQSPVVGELLDAARRLPVNGSIGLHVTIGFDLGDAGSYRLVAHNGRLFLDSHAADAETVLSTDADTLLALLHGKLNPRTTIISGRARLEGDPELAGRLLAFLGRQASPAG